MKRFQMHAHVADLRASVAFYAKLFGLPPTRLEGLGIQTDSVAKGVCC